jgi:hypothetical protein
MTLPSTGRLGGLVDGNESVAKRRRRGRNIDHSNAFRSSQSNKHGPYIPDGAWPPSGRFSRLFFFHSNGYRRVRGQANFLTFNFRDQAQVDEMMMAFVTAFTAIKPGEPDLAILNSIDGPNVNAVGSNNFHVLFYERVAHFNSFMNSSTAQCKTAPRNDAPTSNMSNA